MIHAILDVLLAFLDERENEKRVSQGSVFFGINFTGFWFMAQKIPACMPVQTFSDHAFWSLGV